MKEGKKPDLSCRNFFNIFFPCVVTEIIRPPFQNKRIIKRCYKSFSYIYKKNSAQSEGGMNILRCKVAKVHVACLKESVLLKPSFKDVFQDFHVNYLIFNGPLRIINNML